MIYYLRNELTHWQLIKICCTGHLEAFPFYIMTIISYHERIFFLLKEHTNQVKSRSETILWAKNKLQGDFAFSAPRCIY